MLLGVLAICWLLPDHFPPWYAYHTEVPAFVAASLGMMISWKKSEQIYKIPSALFVILLLMLVAVAQYMTGLLRYRGDLFVAIAYLGVFGCAWLWGYRWSNKLGLKQVIDGMSCLLVFIGLATAFQVLAQWFRVEYAMHDWVLEGYPVGSPRGNIGQRNQAATSLLMASIAVVVLRIRIGINKHILCATLIVLGSSIVLTQSRTAILSATILTFVCISILTIKNIERLTRWEVVLWLILLYFGALILPYVDFFQDGIGRNINELATFGTRPLIWKQLYIALLQKPIFGWGWLQVSSAQQAGALQFPGNEQVNYAHNIILDLAIYAGMPITLFVMTVAVLWFWRKVSGERTQNEVVMAFMIIIPFLVHAMLELPHAYAYFIVIPGVLFGAIDAATESAASWTISMSRWLISAFFIGWIIFLLGMAYQYALAEEDFRINRFENRRIGVTDKDYVVPKLSMLTQLGELLQAMRLRAQPSMLPEDVEVLLRVAKRYTWAPIQFRAALALGLNQRPIEAAERMLVLKNTFPSFVYEDAVSNFKALRDGKYPVLHQVIFQ